MLFLLNDVVLNLEGAQMAPPVAAQRFKALTMGFVEKLGRELFSEEPLLQHRHPERARRLAGLILLKQPTINAALFVAQARGCPENIVAVRYAQISFEVMGLLYERQQAGSLTTVEADRQVWRRLAA
ncbi:MAG: hypothetical protein KF842_05860 [Caulobacter sp.]|nr:hypothetical protein [Caulobacter sp.]